MTMAAVSKRAQMSLYALIAVAVVLMILMGAFTRWRSTEATEEVREIRARHTKRLMEKAQELLGTSLESAVHRTADEMAVHGGYLASSVPKESVSSIPYWFLRGKVVSIPSVEAMEGMLSYRIAELIAKDLEESREDALWMGFPEVSVRLYDTGLLVKASIDAKGSEDGERGQLTSEQEVPLHLKPLRDLAERYVRNYTVERTIEASLLNALIQDPRIPAPPGMVTKNLGCSEQEALAYKRDMIAPMRENARMAVALELRRLAESDLVTRETEWSIEADERGLEFSLLANEGVQAEGHDWESTNVVYHVPARMPHSALAEEGMCSSYYTVAYTARFPVEVTITDLSKPGMLKGVEGSTATRPLTFKIMLGILVEHNEPDAVDLNITLDENVTDLCTGACSLRVIVENSNAGHISLDTCSYEYRGEVFSAPNVPCGVHSLVVESGEPIGLARYAKQVNIVGNYTEQIAFTERSTVLGKVVVRERVYCTSSGTVRDLGDRPAGFVDGEPPMYIKVVIRSLEGDDLETRSTIADEDGRFLLSGLDPGEYLVLARSSLDLTNIPSYKVQPAAFIQDVMPGRNEIEIVLEPLLMELVDDTYVAVSSRKEC